MYFIVNILSVFFIFLLPLCVYQFWSATNTTCVSDDAVENKKDTFFIFVQMNPYAVCNLRGCKAVYQNEQNWIIDHFFPWHGKYGLSLTTVRPCTGNFRNFNLTNCNGTPPCPFGCDSNVKCTTFSAGDYKDSLTKYWPDPINFNQQLRWQTEWSHVQTCFQLAQDVAATSYSKKPSVLYAKEIVNLYKTNNITSTLTQHNITPSDLHSYLLKDVQNALSSKVILGCRLIGYRTCVLTRIGFCFSYTSSLEPTLIDCPDLQPGQKERPLPWILFDYSFDGTYTEDGFVCNCKYVKYYGPGHD